jgi:hypothetical protein
MPWDSGSAGLVTSGKTEELQNKEPQNVEGKTGTTFSIRSLKPGFGR